MILLLAACSGDPLPNGGPIPSPSDDAADLASVDTNGAETFAFDTDTSLLMVQVFKDDKGHDHAIRAEGITGSVTYDSADPSSFAMSFEVPVADMLVDEAELREFVGFEEIKEGNRSGVRDHMLEMLDAENHPNITCTGTAIAVNGDAAVLTTEWSIAGGTTTQDIELDWKVTEDGLYADGSFEIHMTDVGMEVPSNPFGNSKDAMTFTVDLHGI